MIVEEVNNRGSMEEEENHRAVDRGRRIRCSYYSLLIAIEKKVPSEKIKGSCDRHRQYKEE